MVTHSSILLGKILWTQEPGGLQSMGSQSQTRLSTRARRTRDGVTYKAQVVLLLQS